MSDEAFKVVMIHFGFGSGFAGLVYRTATFTGSPNGSWTGVVEGFPDLSASGDSMEAVQDALVSQLRALGKKHGESHGDPRLGVELEEQRAKSDDIGRFLPPCLCDPPCGRARHI